LALKGGQELHEVLGLSMLLLEGGIADLEVFKAEAILLSLVSIPLKNLFQI